MSAENAPDLTDARAAALYDAVPYPSRPQPETHPERMAVVARLFGLPSPDPAHARVLELGCADGGNLLPMAHYLPDARFFGIDVSPQSIERAHAATRRLALENVRVLAADLRAVDPRGAPCDYVICHGVWSWVEPSVREGILRLIRRSLSPDGVALISYNTWPGWNILRPARDIMRLVADADAHARPRETVEAGLALVEEVADAHAETNPVYAGMLYRTITAMRRFSPEYLFHDLLAPINEPFYVTDFVGRIEQEGLRYLGEAWFGAMMPFGLPGGLGDRAEALTRDLVTMQQALDHLRSNTFRYSLVCREDRTLERCLDAGSLAGLHVRLLGEPGGEDDDGHPVWVKDETLRVTSTDRLTGALLERLHDVRPGTLPFDALPGPGTPDEVAGRVLQLYAAGLLDLHLAAREPVAVPARPALHRLAAWELPGDGVSTRYHGYVSLGRLDRTLLAACDGTRDETALVAEVAEAARSGLLEVSLDGAPTRDPEVIHTVCAGLVPQQLSHLATLGLFR